MEFAEYKGKYYASTEQDNGAAYEFVCRDLSGGELQVLGRWESHLPEKEVRASLRVLSHGAAYIAVNKTHYVENRETGMLDAENEPTELWRFDLNTGTSSIIVENLRNTKLYGAWDNCIIFSRREIAAGAPDYLKEYLPSLAEGEENRYNDLYANYSLIKLDFNTKTEQLIASGITETADPNISWGKYVIYQQDRTLFVYDIESGEVQEVFTHEKLRNYYIMDGRAVALVIDRDICRVFMTELATGDTLELDNKGEAYMLFSAVCESNTVFRGCYQGRDHDIRKEDFYSGNYEAYFR